MTRPLVTTAAAALAVGALAGCTGSDRAGPGPTTTPTPDPTSPSPSATASPSPTPTPYDGPLAAVTAEGDVVLIDVGTGAVQGTLLTGVDVTDPAANAIDMTTDGQTVFVNRPAADGSADIVRVPVDGGEPEVVVQGGAPTVSPDGGTLAYTAPQDGTPPEPAVVLHDLATGGEVTLGTDGNYVYVGELTWTADGSELAFMAGEISTGIWVVDAGATSLDAARRLGPADPGTSWRASAVTDDGRLAVVAVTGDPPDPEAWTVRTVDVPTGEVLGQPLPQDRVEAGPVDARPGEPGLLLVEAAGPGGGRLLLWDGEDELRELADGIITAAW